MGTLLSNHICSKRQIRVRDVSMLRVFISPKTVLYSFVEKGIPREYRGANSLDFYHSS